MSTRNSNEHSSSSNEMSLANLENTLDLYLVDKAPAIPTKWKEVLVKFLPWITLVMFILFLPIVLAVLGIGALLLPFSFIGGVGNGMMYTLAVIVLAASLVLEALAIPGLFKQTRRSWNLLFYAALINALYNLLTFNLSGLVIGTLISLYLLFQIKSYYTK
jgi:hypothetical protein